MELGAFSDKFSCERYRRLQNLFMKSWASRFLGGHNPKLADNEKWGACSWPVSGNV